MKTTTRAVVMSHWGYKPGSLQASADSLKGKPVTIQSYRIGTVVDAHVVGESLVTTIEVELPNGDN